MKLNVTPEEFLDLYDTLCCDKSNETVFLSMRESLLELLQSEEDTRNHEKAKTWMEQEKKRIEDLTKKNDEILGSVVSRPRRTRK